MAETTQEIQEAPELAALGSPDVASGDLPIGLRALIDAGVGEASKATGITPEPLSPWGNRGRSLMTRGHR